MGAENKEDCVFSADNARARREAFERDVLPDLEMKMAADRERAGIDTAGG